MATSWRQEDHREAKGHSPTAHGHQASLSLRGPMSKGVPQFPLPAWSPHENSTQSQCRPESELVWLQTDAFLICTDQPTKNEVHPPEHLRAASGRVPQVRKCGSRASHTYVRLRTAQQPLLNSEKRHHRTCTQQLTANQRHHSRQLPTSHACCPAGRVMLWTKTRRTLQRGPEGGQTRAPQMHSQGAFQDLTESNPCPSLRIIPLGVSEPRRFLLSAPRPAVSIVGRARPPDRTLFILK